MLLCEVGGSWVTRVRALEAVSDFVGEAVLAAPIMKPHSKNSEEHLELLDRYVGGKGGRELTEILYCRHERILLIPNSMPVSSGRCKFGKILHGLS